MNLFAGRFFLWLSGLAALALLISLGVWQLHRRDWKAGIIAKIERSLTEQPAPYIPPPANDAEDTEREFKPVHIEGTLLRENSFKELVPAPESMRAFTKEGFGYLIFSPLNFGSGIVFINRGFVPASLADGYLKGAPEPAAVTGLIRITQPPGWFTPAAEIGTRTFYTADIPAMASNASLPKERVVFGEYIEADATANEGDWPKGRDPKSLLAIVPNRHFEYALTWFGFAVGLTGVFIAYLRSGRNRRRFAQH